MQDKHSLEKNPGNVDANLTVMLSSSGSKVYAIHVIRLHKSSVNSDKKM